MKCYDKAKEWVHTYAVGGAAFAALPIPVPGLTSGGLVAAETHMVYWIARIYGEELSLKEIAIVLSGLELAGIGLKTLAMEVCNFIPIAGWIAKSAIAGSAIEAIGHLIIKHFEDKYPGKEYSVDPKVEESLKQRR
jgi:uncharacterized protein (DUF697 family)